MHEYGIHGIKLKNRGIMIQACPLFLVSYYLEKKNIEHGEYKTTRWCPSLLAKSIQKTHIIVVFVVDCIELGLMGHVATLVIFCIFW